MDGKPLLDVSGLDVGFRTDNGILPAVRQARFSLGQGEVLGVVGESGSGKSTLGMSLVRLLPDEAVITAGRVQLDDVELTTLAAAKLRVLRGSHLAMIFQNPMTALNPTETVGSQIAEMLQASELTRSQIKERIIDLLEQVGIPDAARRANNYPHEFSGGMRQRALIALAIARNPRLLVADEPTTALDVTVQNQILWLLDELRRRNGMAMLFVTHNLAVAGAISNRVAVMYAGSIVELGPARSILEAPRHPYTIGLLKSVPRTPWRQGRIASIAGQPPTASAIDLGCPFRERCERATALCAAAMPPEVSLGPAHVARCYHVQ